ncbi:protein kinase [Anatilimnocola sp. NA78]|uniref:protein kinase domain-containing protein n=1 Tax=Anatilimnocola sp. NA78 TaxID=3415683 RepID=UPI003CE50F36
MPDDPRVRELLDELFDQNSTPEEICVHCPELLPVVSARWRQICWARATLDEMLLVPPHEADTPQMSDGLPQVPGYEVDSVLGQGGMGIVFRARQVKLSRLVALKMTLAGSYASEHERERFRREAETVAALRHANVVQIFDVGDLAGRPYFTMELIEGGSLAQRQAGVPQPPREAAALVATLAEGVHAAHQGGIVHRDLKPANILFTPAGTPKITDFGLARRIAGGAELTLSGVPLGTPAYMAPEQALGQSREIGPTADVYALGAILYELLTGRTPFRGETPTETLLQVIHHEPVPPNRLNRQVPRDLQTICLTCLQKEPRQRYVTAAALADDLHCFLNGEAIAARPETFLMTLVRRISRQPVLATAVAIAVLSTLAFAGGGLWLLSDRSAKAQAAHGDVRDMVRYLNESSWQAASAARDRAEGRLGIHLPGDLRQSIDQGSRDLKLAARLEEFQSEGLEATSGGVPFTSYDTKFMNAFRAAGLGAFADEPEVVARRIRESNIRDALLAALERYSIFIYPKDVARGSWALQVSSQADRDQSAWRLRARDIKVLKDRAAVKELIATRPATDPAMIPLFTLEVYVSDQQLPLADRLALMRQLYQGHSSDFYLNLRLGSLLRQNGLNSEALGYMQAATALRPQSAVAHWHFGCVLWDVGRREEAVAEFRRGTELDPTNDFHHQHYARHLSLSGRHSASIEYLRGILPTRSQSAILHTELGLCLDRQGPETDPLAWFTKGVELDPTLQDSQKALRDYLLKRGKLEKLQTTWQLSLAKDAAKYSAWYGYAELCLFLGKEEEYRNARREMLKRFGGTKDPRFAEQVSRLSLLMPVAGEELATAVSLAERALSSKTAKTGGFHSYYLFARGLAEYRQDKFDAAIATMKGDASRVLGPAPRLVLAMALHRSGKEQEARHTLAAAVSSHDWRLQHCKTQDAWIYHVLRREAEQLILPDLAAFLAGSYQPQDNDERLALTGICQFKERNGVLARLYEEAFAADPSLLGSANGYRYAAAKAAASAGCGRGSDAAGLRNIERSTWRGQALEWLRQELAVRRHALDQSNEQIRTKTLQGLRQFQTDDELAGLREASELEKLPPAERKIYLSFWADLTTVLGETKSP